MGDNIFDQFDAPRPIGPPPTAAVPTNPFDQFDGPPAQPALPKDATDWSKYNKPFGELKPYDPSFTQRVKDMGQDTILAIGQALGGKPDPYITGRVSSGAVDAGKTINPMMGSVLSGADATYDVLRGKYGDAAWNAVGALPGVLAGKRIIQGIRGELPIVRMADTPTRVIDPVTGAPNDELINSARDAYGRAARAPIEFHPDAIGDYADRTRAILQQPGGGPFTPESAPGVYATLDRWQQAMQQRGTTITPYDFDTLRGHLRSFTEGADSAAGQRAATILDRYLQSPPPGAVVRSAPGALDTLRDDLAMARGDYRAGKTAAAVEQAIDRAGTKAASTYSGGNVDNKTRQALSSLTTTDAGANRIFGATYPERQAINEVAEGDSTTNRARAISNKLGGGGGLGNTGIGALAGSTATAIGHAMGMDPYTSFAMGGAAGYGVAKAGTTLRGIANERTVRAADEVVDMIRRNSPLYRNREAAVGPPSSALSVPGQAVPPTYRGGAPITDPASMMRDAVTYALMPQMAQGGKSIWDSAHVPYANREEQQ